MNKSPKQVLIEVDKKKLEYFFATTCPHFLRWGECENECTKDKSKRCQLDEWTKENICVPDCPHFKDIPLRECSFGKCSVVKKAIKDLI